MFCRYSLYIKVQIKVNLQWSTFKLTELLSSHCGHSSAQFVGRGNRLFHLSWLSDLFKGLFNQNCFVATLFTSKYKLKWTSNEAPLSWQSYWVVIVAIQHSLLEKGIDCFTCHDFQTEGIGKVAFLSGPYYMLVCHMPLIDSLAWQCAQIRRQNETKNKAAIALPC